MHLVTGHNFRRRNRLPLSSLSGKPYLMRLA